MMIHPFDTQIHCEVPQMIPSSNETVGNDINLQMHSLQDLLTSNTYKCDKCDAILNTKVTFLRHTLRHREGRKWKCEQCALKFAARDDLLQHYRTHYKEGKHYDCMVDSCTSVFTTYKALITHLDENHIIRDSLCKLCSRKFKTNRQYLYHLMGKHREHVMITQQTPIEQEQPENLSWQQLIESMSPSITRSDDSCSLSLLYENEEKISEYTNSMSSGNSLTPSPNDFESAFPQSSLFSDLLLSGIFSNNNNIISSSSCANSCDSMQAANTAESSAAHSHTTEALVCPHCEMLFDNSLLYLVHLVCHYPNEPFKCRLCGMKLKDKQTFHNHLAFAEHNYNF